jgi:hypothetical protein
VRRGGWSGVVRLTLARPEGGEVGIFVKRQENHTYREWRRFALPAATFEREFVKLMHFQRLGIPTLEPLYFGKRRVDGNLRAILVTLELSGCDPLDAPRWNPLAQTKPQHRRSLIRQIAETIRRMHAQYWQHNCLIRNTCLPGSSPEIQKVASMYGSLILKKPIGVHSETASRCMTSVPYIAMLTAGAAATDLDCSRLIARCHV